MKNLVAIALARRCRGGMIWHGRGNSNKTVAVIGGLMLFRLTKRSLLLAGEIRPEEKISARVLDKPREHISIH